jgi:DNA-binding transcriptional MocR family regulator
MASLREQIARRALGPGARLPSVRATADALGVSKSTVVEAYERLVAEGEIRARPGSGFYVAPRARPFDIAAASPPRPDEVDPMWVMRQSLSAPDGVLNPGCGWLPDDWLPLEAIRRALRAQARADERTLVGYGDPQGFAPLRQLLARRLGERSIVASPSDILLTESGSHAIDLVSRVLIRPGDTVLVDDPCYFNVINLLRLHRANIVGVPYTPSGPDVEAFARAAAQHAPRLYVTTASLHNPTGASPTPAVQHRLLQIAQQHEMAIIEDDIFSDFDPNPSPTLAALDGLERVVLIGSFSKTLSAGVRCGFVAARPAWLRALFDARLATGFGGVELPARVVHTLLVDGGYRRHVDVLRARLARARSDVAARLERLGFRLWCTPRGGLFLWAQTPGRSAVEAARRARENGLILAPGDVFSIHQSAPDFMRFNVAQCGSPRMFETLRAALQ